MIFKANDQKGFIREADINEQEAIVIDFEEYLFGFPTCEQKEPPEPVGLWETAIGALVVFGCLGLMLVVFYFVGKL